MTNNYYDATGVLLLEKVTPVITAFFGGYKLDESHPGDGAAYIAQLSESNNPQWNDVKDKLIALAKHLNLIPADSENVSFESVLSALAIHFGTDKNEDLISLIDYHRFDEFAELDALFLLATCFNDGHNLTAIQFEGCWHCTNPRLFEFGGNGSFISKEVRLFETSTHVLQLGEKLRNAIMTDAFEDAATLITQETLRIFSGIQNEKLRKKLQREVAIRLITLTA